MIGSREESGLRSESDGGLYRIFVEDGAVRILHQGVEGQILAWLC